MIDRPQLLTDLQRLLKKVEDDLRLRSDSDAAIKSKLTAQYEVAKTSQRTASAYSVWRDELVTQVGVAWLLGCVFVRFLEDNDFLDTPLLSGPGDRLTRARDQHEAYFRSHPIHSDRDYLEHVFRTVKTLPSLDALFNERHNPLWQFSPSGDLAGEILRFFQAVDPDTGTLKHDFTDATGDTRFLGDLYQDLSEAARKRYALLQTPRFVEEFILDRTLDPAIECFGLEKIRMIDPTCGSGHFVLGAFERILERWRKREPGTSIRELVQRTLDSVYGVDLNPFAIAIAQFRLVIAVLRACEIQKLRLSPGFRIHLASGDSLLHGRRFRSFEGVGIEMTFDTEELFRDELKHHYEVEDVEALHHILGQQYHAVVGNPPYITVKDRALSELYRARYPSCRGKYSLSVPFMERFFDLAVKGDGTPRQPAGFVGQITANSFMKREFGKKLIEEYLPRWDLTHVLDTSGAYIPGHGTPTVILFGKNQPFVSGNIRTVLGIRGEPVPPEIPEKGEVWLAITRQIDDVGSESEWVSAADSPRANFHRHPWSISGGGAADVMESLTTEEVLGSKVSDMGMSTYSGADEVYLLPELSSRRLGAAHLCAPSLVGDDVRDFSAKSTGACLVPYEKRKLIPFKDLPERLAQHLWLHRIGLSNRLSFGRTHAERGMAWYEPSMFFFDRFDSERKICHAYVATHNHFVLLNGRFATNRHAPVIQLPTDSTDDDYVRFLGLLNSSAGVFWMKQLFHCKGGQGINEGAKAELWERFTEFDSTKLKKFPIPAQQPTQLPTLLVQTSTAQQGQTPAATLASWGGPGSGDLRACLARARDAWHRQRRQLIAWQEELDWQIYEAFGLVENGEAAAPLSPTTVSQPEGQAAIPPEGLELGQRAFEIVLARRLAAGEVQTTWFARHGSTPITEVPPHWPAAYRELVERRLRRIADDPAIRLIEQPEYKRRWNTEPWDEQLKTAAESWLLARLEGYFHEGQRVCELKDGFNPAARGFAAASAPVLVSANQIAAVAETDPAFVSVAEVYVGSPGFSVPKLVRDLVDDASVPALPLQRYKESGLRNRSVWEEVWDLQRKEDAIDAEVGVDHPGINAVEKSARETQSKALKKERVGEIPVPPKYSSKDFKSGTFWKLRGKLDVPKERWVSYPGAERGADTSLVIAWAGWDHLQQAKALTAYLEDIKSTGASDAQQLLVLASLGQLIPWLLQWHNAIDPEFGERLGDYFRNHLTDELRRLGKTEGDLRTVTYGLT